MKTLIFFFIFSFFLPPGLAETIEVGTEIHANGWGRVQYSTLTVRDEKTKKLLHRWSAFDHQNEILENFIQYAVSPKNSDDTRTDSNAEFSFDAFSATEIPENQVASRLPVFKPGSFLVTSRQSRLFFILDSALERIEWTSVSQAFSEFEYPISGVVAKNGQIIFIKKDLHASLCAYDPMSHLVTVLYPHPEASYLDFKIFNWRILLTRPPVIFDVSDFQLHPEKIGFSGKNENGKTMALEVDYRGKLLP